MAKVIEFLCTEEPSETDEVCPYAALQKDHRVLLAD